MKSTGTLTHSEIMEGLAMCYRQLIATEVTSRNMPNIINQGKAAAAVITAHHREELMEAKRQGATIALKSAEQPTLKKLKQK
jgi:hypothetical protein